MHEKLKINVFLNKDFSSNIRLLRISLYLLLLFQINLFYPLIGNYQEYYANLPRQFPGVFGAIFYNHFLYESFPANLMVIIFASILFLGMFFENILLKILICLLSYSFHHYMAGSVDAGDALIDTFSFFMVFLRENNKNRYSKLLTNSIYFAALFQVTFVYVMAGLSKKNPI